MHKLPYKLPEDLRLSILGNYNFLRKSLKNFELLGKYLFSYLKDKSRQVV